MKTITFILYLVAVFGIGFCGYFNRKINGYLLLLLGYIFGSFVVLYLFCK